MTGARTYADDPAGPFPTPPRSIVDDDGRRIDIEAYDGSFDALVSMYEAFDPADRAQGLPPVRSDAIREWLADVLGAGRNVVAWDEDAAVGHATLVPDDHGEHELAIFVLQSHQSAGIGSALIETLLGHGAATGVERVWLSVERWNEPARRLYRSVGFETADAASFELEMTLRLDPTASVADGP
jgi:ribosomal protein S18 acetylase RimI-like enzyme